MPETTETGRQAGQAQPGYERRYSVKELNTEAKEYLLEIAGDYDGYRSYLGTVAKFPSYSAMNAAHIHQAAPDAMVLKDADTWFREGSPVKKGEQGIPVTYPEKKRGGQPFFKVKYLFSEGQVVGGQGLGRPAWDKGLLEEAFAASSVPGPLSSEGRYIVGQHFGLASYLKEGVLPPADLCATDSVEEALDNIKDYVDGIRREANGFIRSVEAAYSALESEQTQERNTGLFRSYMREEQRQAQPERARQPEAAVEAAPAQGQGLAGTAPLVAAEGRPQGTPPLQTVSAAELMQATPEELDRIDKQMRGTQGRNPLFERLGGAQALEGFCDRLDEAEAAAAGARNASSQAAQEAMASAKKADAVK